MLIFPKKHTSIPKFLAMFVLFIRLFSSVTPVIIYSLIPLSTSHSQASFLAGPHLARQLGPRLLKYLLFIMGLPNIVVEWPTLLLRIREIPDSNLVPETGYSDCFRGFPQSLQRMPKYELKIRPRPLPSKSFSIHHSLISPSFYTI
jgi:hypothetical protein